MQGMPWHMLTRMWESFSPVRQKCTGESNSQIHCHQEGSVVALLLSCSVTN